MNKEVSEVTMLGIIVLIVFFSVTLIFSFYQSGKKDMQKELVAGQYILTKEGSCTILRQKIPAYAGISSEKIETIASHCE